MLKISFRWGCLVVELCSWVNTYLARTHWNYIKGQSCLWYWWSNRRNISTNYCNWFNVCQQLESCTSQQAAQGWQHYVIFFMWNDKPGSISLWNACYSNLHDISKHALVFFFLFFSSGLKAQRESRSKDRGRKIPGSEEEGQVNKNKINHVL